MNIQPMALNECIKLVEKFGLKECLIQTKYAIDNRPEVINRLETSNDCLKEVVRTATAICGIRNLYAHFHLLNEDFLSFELWLKSYEYEAARAFDDINKMLGQ